MDETPKYWTLGQMVLEEQDENQGAREMKRGCGRPTETVLPPQIHSPSKTESLMASTLNPAVKQMNPIIFLARKHLGGLRHLKLTNAHPLICSDSQLCS